MYPVGFRRTCRGPLDIRTYRHDVTLDFDCLLKLSWTYSDATYWAHKTKKTQNSNIQAKFEQKRMLNWIRACSSENRIRIMRMLELWVYAIRNDKWLMNFTSQMFINSLKLLCEYAETIMTTYECRAYNMSIVYWLRHWRSWTPSFLEKRWRCFPGVWL